MFSRILQPIFSIFIVPLWMSSFTFNPPHYRSCDVHKNVIFSSVLYRECTVKSQYMYMQTVTVWQFWRQIKGQIKWYVYIYIYIFDFFEGQFDGTPACFFNSVSQLRLSEHSGTHHTNSHLRSFHRGLPSLVEKD